MSKIVRLQSGRAINVLDYKLTWLDYQQQLSIQPSRNVVVNGQMALINGKENLNAGLGYWDHIIKHN